MIPKSLFNRSHVTIPCAVLAVSLAVFWTAPSASAQNLAEDDWAEQEWTAPETDDSDPLGDTGNDGPPEAAPMRELPQSDWRLRRECKDAYESRDYARAEE
ncbi:MAG: hypothetical protein WEB93_07390, partial [Sphingomonadales bacterium]